MWIKGMLKFWFQLGRISQEGKYTPMVDIVSAEEWNTVNLFKLGDAGFL